ncbi:RNA-directed DNA polymerase from mobile element jockey [Eumeta japonica]|uniref:RNA-directed DNA polymerase from mobile element jockey n=1 Tax=Eumeta variegata TaxID=151549 RepID=A0A4C1TDR7_EUMVA|nr:RNA-directed DNA polymerase from mobile element jockey [Eumeta japonica]
MHRSNGTTLGLVLTILERSDQTVGALEYHADIIMMREILLKPKKAKTCKIRNFTQLRTDRPIPTLTNIEATACSLSMAGHGIMILVSVYLPPKKKLLWSDLEVLFALGDAVILFGDFNSKITHWNCNHSNRSGRKMVQLTEELHFDIITPLTPTRYPSNENHRSDILDITLVNALGLKVSCIETLQCLSSDHPPVIMRLGSLTEEIDTSNLNTIPNDIVSTYDVDEAIGALTNHVNVVVENSSRVVPANSDHNELPRDVNELKRAKNAAVRRASKYPTCENKSHARAFRRYWGLAKAFKTEGYVPTSTLRKPDNSIAFDDHEKDDTLADSIEQKYFDNPPHKEEVRQSLLPTKRRSGTNNTL